jgi:hypothetical protein
MMMADSIEREKKKDTRSKSNNRKPTLIKLTKTNKQTKKPKEINGERGTNKQETKQTNKKTPGSGAIEFQS